MNGYQERGNFFVGSQSAETPTLTLGASQGKSSLINKETTISQRHNFSFMYLNNIYWESHIPIQKISWTDNCD